MAKKPKPGKANAPKAEPKQAESTSPKASIKSGLMGIMLPSLVGSAIAAAICGVLIMILVIQPGSQQQIQITGQAHAQQYLQDLVQLGKSLQAGVAKVANSSLVKEALAAGNTQEREQQLQELFPSASSVKIFPKGKARKTQSTVPPISFSQLDMVAKAEKKDNATPEIHSHEKKSYLTIVKAIQNGDKIIGSLLVSFELDALRTQLPELAAETGYVEIIQTFANQPSVVYSSGNAAHKQGAGIEAKGNVAHWSAVFYPSENLNVIGGYMGMAWGLVGASVVLVLLCAVISFVLLNKALQSNATALASHFQALFAHEKPSKAFSLGIFASMAQTMQRLFEDYDRKTRQKINQAQQGQATATAEEKLPDFDPNYSNDDVLDIDIHEDDNDLLSGAATLDDSPLDLDEVDMAEPEMVKMDVQVSAEIFRAYDIRGIVGDTLDKDVAYALGSAIGSEAKDNNQDTVIVGRDGRHSSPELAESLAGGIQSTGVNVIDIGVVATPLVYYATKTLNTQSGVMVTGSHNPPDYNGFKIVIADETLARDRIQGLRTRIEEGKLHKGQGQYEAADVSSDYLERICSDVVLAKPMRVVVDSGNGVAGPIASRLLDALGCMVTPLYADIDGNFPNHHPDPSNPDNLQDLIRTVQAEGAELGIAFDGDGDRLGVVTPDGKVIWPDRLLMLYARDLLSRNPGADILYDVKCSRDVAELVSSLGGRAIMSATGHSLMKAKMKETGAVVGGELSGHIFFNDRWYGFDDALYSAARMLEILSMEPISAEDVFAEFPEKVSTPELQVKVTEANKFRIMEKLEANGQFDGGNLVKLDGVRVDFPNSWGLIRASNTTPVLVARFEGDSEEALDNVKSIFRDQLLAVEPGLDIPF